MKFLNLNTENIYEDVSSIQKEIDDYYIKRGIIEKERTIYEFLDSFDLTDFIYINPKNQVPFTFIECDDLYLMYSASKDVKDDFFAFLDSINYNFTILKKVDTEDLIEANGIENMECIIHDDTFYIK